MQKFFIVILQIYFLVLPLYSTAGENLPAPNGDTKQILDALARLEVPKELINIGKWDEDSFVLLAEKQSQKLYLFDNSYNLIKTFQITTGQNNGNKERVGDKKTPEGVYFFTSVKEDKELLPQYGLLAIPINYPNFFDRLDNKNGNGIWLHATDQPARPIKPFDTRGCIVAVNEDVLELARYIKLETTPLVIVDKIEFVPLEVVKEEDQEAREFLKKWHKSWEGKNLDEYMSFYSSDFKSRGMDLKAWKKYKASLNQINSERKVSIRGVKILRHADNIIASFIQHYIGEGTNDTGIKRLYLEDTEDGLKIIGEEWNAMPKQDLARIADRLSEKLPAASIKQQTAKIGENPSLQKTSAVNNGANNEKTSKTKTKETMENKNPDIAIEDFSIDRGKEIKVKFKLVNKKDENHKLQGRLAIIGIGANKKAASYPAMKLSNGVPKNFEKGEWYSIKWFKIVEGKLGKDRGFKNVKVIVYSLKGEIILEKEFPI